MSQVVHIFAEVSHKFKKSAENSAQRLGSQVLNGQEAENLA